MISERSVHRIPELIHLDRIFKKSEILEAFVHSYSNLMLLERIFKWSQIPHFMCSAGDIDCCQINKYCAPFFTGKFINIVHGFHHQIHKHCASFFMKSFTNIVHHFPELVYLGMIPKWKDIIEAFCASLFKFDVPTKDLQMETQKIQNGLN